MSDVTTTTTDIKSDSEPWSVLENLILAQAIYKCGDTNWVAIARTIKGHPQIHRSSNFFSQKVSLFSRTLYVSLRYSFQWSASHRQQSTSAHTPTPTRINFAYALSLTPFLPLF
jgi:hypothetical protein